MRYFYVSLVVAVNEQPLLTDAAPIETFTLGALVLGAAISGIRSGRANSADAHQSVGKSKMTSSTSFDRFRST